MGALQILSATTHKISAVVDATATTNESRVVTNYAEQTSAAPHTPATAVQTTNGTTPVDLLAAPAASVQRTITNFVIWNRDTVDHTYTIYLDISGTAYNLYTAQSVLAGKSTILSLSGGGASGSVTSVAFTAAPASVFGVSGSPITSTGTLALTMDNQNANVVLAGPTSGGAAEPAFRALVAGDLPVLAFNQITAWTELGVDTSSVTISSIPATYKHLLLVLRARTDRAATTDDLLVRPNSDSTAANYHKAYIQETNGTVTGGQDLSSVATLSAIDGSVPGASGSAGYYAAVNIFITDYASTTRNRIAIFDITCPVDGSTLKLMRGGSHWLNAANAISSIFIGPRTGSNLKAGSAYALYGVL